MNATGRALMWCVWLWLPAPALAMPKVDLKLSAGVGFTAAISRLPHLDLYDDDGNFIASVGGRSGPFLPGWQVGVGARVRQWKGPWKVFGEVGLAFARYQIQLTEDMAFLAEAQDRPLDPDLTGARAWMNAIDIPLVAGYVLYDHPYFRPLLSAGLVTRIHLNGTVQTDGGRRFPSGRIPGYPVAPVQLGMRFGAQCDLTLFNIDVNYTVGLTNYTKTDIRTTSHVLQLNLGYVF